MDARKDYHKRNIGWMDSGYRWICTPDGREMAEHRYFMEQHIGRRLHIDECVHHINGNKIDNSLENLHIIPRDAHTREHRAINPLGYKRAKTLISFPCPVCGIIVEYFAGHDSKKTCSHQCGSMLMWRLRRAS